MSKKKSKKTVKPTVSKAERKALEAREAELAAELAKREKKAAKKKGSKKAKAVEPKPSKKKGGKKKAKAEPVVEPMTITATAEAPIPAAPVEIEDVDTVAAPTAGQIIDAAEKVLADANATPGAREKAEKALKRAKADTESDEEIKARIMAKRAERDAKAPGSAERLAAAAEKVAAGKKARKVKAGELGDPNVPESLRLPGETVTEIIETEVGREFAVGSPTSDEPTVFVKPSDATPELEAGRNGYKIIQLGADGKPDPRKVRQMTRVTTYVGNIDDETTLKAWDKRKVVEGLALDATAPESHELIAKVNDIAHRRDVKIAKAIKADRKGKAGVGDVGRITKEAEKEAKDALDAIVEEAAELAGRNDKARAGTHLHSLAEISDEKGIDAVRKMHESGETIRNEETGEDVPITKTDLASIEAYAARMTRLGAKVLYSEAVIVNDELGYAGRLDRVLLVKLPELKVQTPEGIIVRKADGRARRYIADIKSGSLEYGAGKISRQLSAYALGDVYDLETGERTRHSAATDIALVFHLPQGAGVCTVHVVDIRTGGLLLKLSGEVRRARNTGRKVINLDDDIADPEAGE